MPNFSGARGQKVSGWNRALTIAGSSCTGLNGFCNCMYWSECYLKAQSAQLSSHQQHFWLQKHYFVNALPPENPQISIGFLPTSWQVSMEERTGKSKFSIPKQEQKQIQLLKVDLSALRHWTGNSGGMWETHHFHWKMCLDHPLISGR